MSLEKEDKSVVLDVKFFIAEFYMLDKDLFHVRAYAHVDLQIPYLPEMMLSFFSSKIGNFMMDKLVEFTRIFKGTEWEKRIREDKDKFYTWLRKKIDDWEKKCTS